MKIAEGYELKQIGEHYLVMQESDRILFALNETGAFLWKGVQSGQSKEELRESLCREYEADPEDEPMITQDVEEFLGQLLERGVLEED